MTEDETVAAVIAWAESVLPELGEARKAPGSEWPLPDIACAIRETTALPGQPIQQSRQRVREVDLVIAVHPEPHDVAASELYGFTQKLMDGLETDTTLGGRASVAEVPGAPLYRVAYGEAVSDLDDGSTALAAVVSFTTRDVVS